MKLYNAIVFAGLLASVLAFLSAENDSARRFQKYPENEYGDPLLLTQYIQDGRIDEGKSLSRVGFLNGTDRESYSGFLTVDATFNSNLFFWYFPAEVNQTTAPVVIWLQGGPGSTSMFGLFVEMGPLIVDEEINLHNRLINWGTPFNLIFFDNPVGTGFSFTDDDAGYANNEVDVAEDLYEALQQFFILWPELQANDFYVTGESYGGKYVPAITYKIMQANPTASLKINLKGLAIGNGWIDPETQFDYGDYLFNVGLLDEYQRSLFYEQQVQMVDNIKAGRFVEANNNTSNMVPRYYQLFTHLRDYYNYLITVKPANQKFYYRYLAKPEVRLAIHTGNLTFSDDSELVYDHLLADICDSTKSWLEALLENNFKVLLYNGQIDVICNYYLQVNMMSTLNWKGAADYKTANRLIWKVESTDGEVAGYVKNARNFWEILVRNGGHILPYDQPRAAYDMITRFIFDKPWTN
ncbi:hypothetical protein CHUAL_005616 [Chamberlinius hualienensis]